MMKTIIVAGPLVGKTVAQIRKEMGIEGDVVLEEEYVPREGERIDPRVEPFLSSQELRKSFMYTENPVYMSRALTREPRTLKSECKDQIALNGAIRDYVLRLTELSRGIGREDLAFAVSAYREAKAALGFLNTQKTVHFPQEVNEANAAFEGLLETLDQLADLFPQPVQKEFWKARAFRAAQSLSAKIASPNGEVCTGVSREAKDPRWFPFIIWGGQTFKAPTFMNAGTLSKRGKFFTKPLYDEETGGLWGFEATWVTRTGKKFAWEVSVAGLVPQFSLVREDPAEVAYQDEKRQGDVFFAPAGWADDRAPEGLNPPSFVGSCSFDPHPIGWEEQGGIFTAKFQEGASSVMVRHPDHRTIKVRVTPVGMWVRPVGGHTHYRPRDRGGD
jgi:hypothetical protein